MREKVHPDRRTTGSGDPIPVSRRHRPLLLVAILFLVLGSLVGLARIGWDLPFPAAFVGAHGPLMVSGFLGTLIVLERAVALGYRWGFVGPAATAAGGLLYGPLALLHASVVVRVLGDVVGGADLRALAGLLNVLAILGFLGSTMAARWAGARESASAAG